MKFCHRRLITTRYILPVNSGHLPPDILTCKAAQVMRGYLYHPSLPLLQSAATLATQGYITQVASLHFDNLDISAVRTEDMASLVKCVSDNVAIMRVHGDLTPVLSNVKCTELKIIDRSLTTIDTQNLLTVMVSGVKEVVLGAEVTLDMETLAQYDGSGECEELWMYQDTGERYREPVKVWARNMGWGIKDRPNWIALNR